MACEPPSTTTWERRPSIQQRLKRALDLALGSLLLVVLSPLLVAVAAGVRLDSPGPILFVPARVGRDGRTFRMYKFRTMCVDAEARLPQLAHLNLGGERLIRIENDPRVTRLGSFLRRTSLDELPQLFNVIKGDMSLVGPRPQSADEVALYTDGQRQRLAVPPGMTGLWQVTARNDPRFDEWIRLDLQYIRDWNLGLDLKILLKTPAVMVRTVSRSTGDLN
jgi:lipopolysaccharide/colanic/teichoic acid biosynthesis glycosyltransferase